MRKQEELYKANCPVCDTAFTRPMRQVKRNLEKGATIITCSVKCGKNRNVRLGLKTGERKISV